MNIPCHIIAGPLGVGKTTAILDHLRRQQDRERIAVIVNDFGQAGIDGEMLAGQPDAGAAAIVAIPGGCLCCSSPIYFEEALGRVIREQSPDRILIEPSGVVLLQALKLDLQRIARNLPLRPGCTIVLLPPARVQERHLVIPFFGQLAHEADCLVANKCDLASEEQLAHFRDWSQRMVPPKRRVVMTRQGVLPGDIFLDDPSAPLVETSSPPAQHPDLRNGLWEADAAHLLDVDRLGQFLRGLRLRLGPGGLKRLKGIVHTDRGWRLIQWTEDTLEISPFRERERSRVEWIWEGGGDDAPIARGLDALR